MDYKKVDLETLNSGAVIEQFEEEFQRVLDNIADPNTKPDAVREVKVSVKIRPNKERSSATTSVQVTSKLTPANPHDSFVMLDYDGRKVSAFTADPKQRELDEDINVREFRTEGE